MTHETLRDEIAGAIFENVLTTMNTDGMGPWNAADAILAKIKDSVPELVWVAPSDGTYHDIDCRYEIQPDGKHWRLLRGVTGGGGYIGHFGTIEAAQAAANAHHVAQLTDWMGK